MLSSDFQSCWPKTSALVLSDAERLAAELLPRNVKITFRRDGICAELEVHGGWQCDQAMEESVFGLWP